MVNQVTIATEELFEDKKLLTLSEAHSAGTTQKLQRLKQKVAHSQTESETLSTENLVLKRQHVQRLQEMDLVIKSKDLRIADLEQLVCLCT